MDKFFGVLVMAVVIEGLITYANMIISKETGVKWQCVASIFLGVFIGIAYDLDLLALFGLTSGVPFVGCVLTGVLMSRGSNYVADLIKMIGNIGLKYKQQD